MPLPKIKRRVDLTPEGEQAPEHIKPRNGPRFRRFEDRVIVWSLGGIAAFLFVIVVAFGYGQVKTISRLQAANERFTKGVCAQIRTLEDARGRELELAVRGTSPESRETHRRSAEEFRGTIIFLNTVVDCSEVKLPLDNSPVPKPRTQSQPRTTR